MCFPFRILHTWLHWHGFQSEAQSVMGAPFPSHGGEYRHRNASTDDQRQDTIWPDEVPLVEMDVVDTRLWFLIFNTA